MPYSLAKYQEKGAAEEEEVPFPALIPDFTPRGASDNEADNNITVTAEMVTCFRCGLASSFVHQRK